MAGPMIEAGELLLDRYSEADLELVIDFMEQGAKIRERHIAWLRSKLSGPNAG
jgi:hypothetical protein